ncbi:MAG: hypothetical protein ACI9SQ_000898 [Rubritalea sp.]|jgi:hypothetical protein
MEAWINYSSSKTSRSTVLGNDEGGWNDDVIIGISPDAQSGIPASNFGISHQGNPGTTRNTPSGALAADEWHHVAVTGSTINGKIIVYIDGVQAGIQDTLVNGATFNGADGFNGSGDFHLTLGAMRSTGGDEFDGLMDEVAIYDQVLTSADLLERANFTPVPEPSSTTLLGLGGLALLLRRLR